MFSPGEEADMLAIARAQLTTYALASRLSEDDERAQASASSLLVSRETSPQPSEVLTMPPTSVRRCTLSLSDLPSLSNTRHMVRAD